MKTLFYLLIAGTLLLITPPAEAQTPVERLAGNVSDHFTWEVYRVTAWQDNDSVDNNGIQTVILEPPMPLMAQNVTPICTVSSYWMADANDDVAWVCNWTGQHFEAAAYRGNNGADYVEFTVLLLDTAVFHLVDQSSFWGCGTQTIPVSVSSDAERLVPIFAVSGYETKGDNDFLFFMEGSLTDFAVHMARGDDDSCLQGDVFLLSLSEDYAAQWGVFTSPSRDESVGTVSYVIDPTNPDMLAFTSLVGYQTGPLGEYNRYDFDSDVRPIDGGFEVDVSVIIDLGADAFDDDFSAASAWNVEGSDLTYTFETAIGNPDTRATWLYYVFQSSDLAALNPDGATTSSDTAGGSGVDSVKYSKAGLAGWDVGYSSELDIQPNEGEGVLHVVNPGSVGYEFYRNEEYINTSYAGEWHWSLPPGTYEIRNGDVTIGQADVSAGQQTDLELASGSAAVVNPGGVGYEIWEAATDGYIVGSYATEWTFGLREGDYTIVQQGQNNVVDFSIGRGTQADITLDTGLATVTNPGGVGYEIWEAATDGYIVGSYATEWTFGLRSGSYYIMQQGQRVQDFSVAYDSTTPVALKTGSATVTNPGGAGYEIYEVGTDNYIVGSYAGAASN